MRMSSALFVLALTLVTSLAHAVDLPIDGADQTASNKKTEVTTTSGHMDTSGFTEISAAEAKVIGQVLTTQYSNNLSVRCKENGGSAYQGALSFPTDWLTSDSGHAITVSRRLGAHPALKEVVKNTDGTQTSRIIYLFDEKGKNIIGLYETVSKVISIPESQENVGTDLVPHLITVPSHDKELPPDVYECDVTK